MKKKIKIMLVEDEVLIAQSLSLELEIAGYEMCKFVAYGEDAIETAKKEKPDIILMDIHLAGKMDGIEAAKKILEFKEIPIIFVSGYSGAKIVERAKQINPAAYLDKPVEAWFLKSIIDPIIK